MALKQAQLTEELLAKLSEDEKNLAGLLITRLVELGYTPRRHRKSTFVVEFEKGGRIIVKLEVTLDGHLKFWMRYSACTSYPELFAAAASQRSAAWVKRGQYWENHDVRNCCGLCKGHPRLYHVVQDNGTQVDTCGGFTKLVPGVTYRDLPDILRMLHQQDGYFTTTLGNAE